MLPANQFSYFLFFRAWRAACSLVQITKLCPHLIALVGYVGTEVEQQKRIEAREEIEGSGSERLIGGVVAGGSCRVACSLLVQGMKWELWEQQGWQRPWSARGRE